MPSEHVRLGGSKAHRWLACHASPALEDQMPDDGPNDAADEGTAAHKLLEMCLNQWGAPLAQVGRSIPVNGKTFVVDGEMAEAVNVAYKWIQNVTRSGPLVHSFVELSVDLAKLNPPEPMRGSADFVCVLPSLGRLVVFDYKHGRGHVVEVAGNKQTRYYALGALLTLDPELVKGVHTVQMVICQPRAGHKDGPVRSETIGLEELLDFASDVMEAAVAVQDPKAPAVPGEHCLFCRAASVCQARQSHALELAQTEFSVLPAIRDTASLEEVAAAVLKYEPLIGRASSWLKDATAFLHKRAVGGDTVPGFELVAKRSTRVWANQEKAKLALIEAGLKESDLYTDPELKSPAQIEKLVGKKNVPDGLTVSVSSGYNLVPSAGNTKPVARLDPANEFETLDNL